MIVVRMKYGILTDPTIGRPGLTNTLVARLCRYIPNDDTLGGRSHESESGSEDGLHLERTVQVLDISDEQIRGLEELSLSMSYLTTSLDTFICLPSSAAHSLEYGTFRQTHVTLAFEWIRQITPVSES